MHQSVLLLVASLCFATIVSCQNETEIEKTFKLLEDGKKIIQLTNETNIVIVMGVSGAGKTTFVQWIAGDNNKLRSVETSPGSEEYFIQDENGKIGLSMASKTLFS